MIFDINDLNFSVEETNLHFNFLFDDLPQNMGITLGNYLRRFLLDYSSGISLIGIKIKDDNSPIKTEFSLLSGVRDSVPIIIQRFKKIIFDYLEDENISNLFNDGKLFQLSLKKKNDSDEEIKITSNDIDSEEIKKSGLVLKNNDLYITTLSPKKDIDIISYWGEWWGYRRSDEQKKKYFCDDLDNEIIVLDTDFSPVKMSNISFDIEKIVTGIGDEKEKMILKISKPENNNYMNIKKIFMKAIDGSLRIFSNILSKIEM